MPVDIHGKQYYTVVERLGMLKADHKQNYSLKTKIEVCDENKVIVSATLSIDGCEFSGLAEEMRNANHINKTSALENCETSAIGRALSSAGYFGTEFCSANELEIARDQQKKQKPKPIPKNVNPIEDDLSETHHKDGSNKAPEHEDIRLTFGKYKGDMLSTCDTGYLKWLSSDKGKARMEGFIDDKDEIKHIQDAAKYYSEIEV